jgi:type VI secretion system protein VasJ
MSLQHLLDTCLKGEDGVALARADAQRWDSWLAPIAGDRAVGEDLGYDDDFQRMRDEVNKLSGADTEWVARQAQTLLSQRGKDLRVATYYLWARLQRDGEAGLADGLGLLAALLERFGEGVWPARPASRRQALEWLASAKVLDGLGKYPTVDRTEARRTAAALAWLEQSLAAGAADRRPALEGLYASLAERLAQSGGIDALVPQQAGSPAPTHAPVGAPAPAPIHSGRELLDRGKALAGYLRDQPLGWLAAHRLLTSLRWDTVHLLPVQEAAGLTRLLPPRGEYRAQLARLHAQQDWRGLLDQVERMFAEGVNHFWLDLQWYLCEALGKLGHPHAAWADIVRRDLAIFLQRLPGLERLCWRDGTPFAEPTTLDWIARPLATAPSTPGGPEPLPARLAEDELQALHHEALAQAEHLGVDTALAWLAARPELHSGRQRWLLRLLMARVAEQYGKPDLALHLLASLDASGQRQALGEWEPALLFEAQARLFKLLRHKAQRSDADKKPLAQRLDSLLASLVALDPVRAAVLCA